LQGRRPSGTADVDPTNARQQSICNKTHSAKTRSHIESQIQLQESPKQLRDKRPTLMLGDSPQQKSTGHITTLDKQPKPSP